MFSVGIIGATGYIGVPYRQEIRDSPKDARIVALCARRRERLEAAATEDGATLVTDDWRQVVEHPDVNVVLVLTPDALHFEAVMACAEQRKHVVCEKPVGVNVDQARIIWKAYEGAGLGHFVPFWTRFVPVFARARQLVHEGLLGEIKTVFYRWHNPRPAAMPFTWRDDAQLSAAGSLADVGSHAYDIVRWILDQDARRVLTHADTITPAKPDLGEIDLSEAIQWGETHKKTASQQVRKGTTYDYASMSIDFPNGTVASIVLSHAPFIRKGLSPELELHGTEASIAVDRLNGRVTIARTGKDPEIVEEKSDNSVNRFAKYVFPALRQRAQGDGQQYPGLDDGFHVQRFTDAAVNSAREGKWSELLAG